MFMLLGGNDKKAKKESSQLQSVKEAKELFNMGRFPVVTTQQIENRPIAKVLGLVCCRGFDSEEAFFGMAAMAVKKGAQGIIGYNENVAFHPDGSKFFSCFGTAVMFEREGRNDLLNDPLRVKSALSRIPTANPASRMAGADSMASMRLNPDMMQHQRVNVIEPLGEDTVSLSNYAQMIQQDNEMTDTEEKQNVLNSAQIAAQMMQEEEAEMKEAVNRLKPSEEEDPVLQRILANQKRQAVSSL